MKNRLRCLTLTKEMKRTDYVSLPPQGVALRPTFSCNLRCKMCSFANGGDVLADLKDHLSLDTWKAIVDDLAQYGCYISLTGGEPLLYPHVADLIEHIKNRGLICIITTNGTLLERHAAKLMENAPDVLIVSIDGPPAVHDELRGRQGTFELATKGVLEIQRLK
ncbi:MAG: radical SAM protein, partial [Armatimonadetes bacterium]|nr:radical SAM protein [Armatimonadota bacterium]